MGSLRVGSDPRTNAGLERHSTARGLRRTTVTKPEEYADDGCDKCRPHPDVQRVSQIVRQHVPTTIRAVAGVSLCRPCYGQNRAGSNCCVPQDVHMSPTRVL